MALMALSTCPEVPPHIQEDITAILADLERSGRTVREVRILVEALWHVVDCRYMEIRSPIRRRHEAMLEEVESAPYTATRKTRDAT